MLKMDEGMAQKQVKDIEQIELVLSKISKKVLYQLQVSVMQEVQSRARMDATNIETSKEAREVLEIVLTKV